MKGVPTEFTDDEFKEILDSYKLQYAKAERMKSRRDGRLTGEEDSLHPLVKVDQAVRPLPPKRLSILKAQR